MTRRFHVSSVQNRASIAEHGLDVSRMGVALGIAGSVDPEQPGVFLCDDEYEVDWFVRMNNTGGPIDVWAVDGIADDALIESQEGHRYFPGPIPIDLLELLRTDVEAPSGPDVTFRMWDSDGNYFTQCPRCGANGPACPSATDARLWLGTHLDEPHVIA
jgi:hypothetical protein